MSRPAELYSQIKMVDPKMLPIWRGFASRYCDGKESFYGYEAKGATNTDELTAILQSRIMIRSVFNALWVLIHIVLSWGQGCQILKFE